MVGGAVESAVPKKSKLSEPVMSDSSFEVVAEDGFGVSPAPSEAEVMEVQGVKEVAPSSLVHTPLPSVDLLALQAEIDNQSRHILEVLGNQLDEGFAKVSRNEQALQDMLLDIQVRKATQYLRDHMEQPSSAPALDEVTRQGQESGSESNPLAGVTITPGPGIGSTLLNAASNAAGSLAGSTLATGVAEGIKAPFDVTANLAKTAEGAAGAVHHAVGTVKDATNIGETITGMFKPSGNRTGGPSEPDTTASSDNDLDARMAQVEQWAATIAKMRQQDIENPAALLEKPEIVKALANKLGKAASKAVKHAIGSSKIPASGDGPATTLDQLIGGEPANKKKKRTVPSACEQLVSTLTRFGANSVWMANIEESLLSATVPSSTNNWVSTYFQTMWSRYPLWHNQVTTNVNTEFIVSSQYYSYSGVGEPHPAFTKQATALPTMGVPATLHYLIDSTVEFILPMRRTIIDEAVLAAYRIGGHINDKPVVATFNTMLHPSNGTLIRDSAFILESNHGVYDNTAMYAKLMHYAMLQEWATLTGFPHVEQAWVVDITFIDLTAPATTWQQITDIVKEGRIVFVDLVDGDFSNADLIAMLYILSTSGRRLSAPAAGRGPSSRYVEWPIIPVAALLQRAAPAVPAAASQSPQHVYNFAEKMARQRGEMDQLIKGIFAAIELLGIDYAPFIANTPHRRALSHLFGRCDWKMYAPRDYNYFMRLLDVKPPQPSWDCSREWDAFMTMSAVNRLQSVAILNAVETAMATTVMAGLNITKQQVMAWVTAGAAPINANLWRLIEHMSMAADPTADATRATDGFMRNVVRAAASSMLGVQLPNSYFPQTEWLGKMGWVPTAPETAAMYTPVGSIHHAPRRGSVLGVGLLLEKYPYEWCFSGYGAHFNIEREVIRYGLANQRGWISHMGDPSYAQTAVGSTPFNLQAYGWQVIHCMLSRYYAAAPVPNLRYYTHRWLPQGIPGAWAQPAANAAYDPEFDGIGLRNFEPCTFKSYDWATSDIIAPTMAENQNWWHRYDDPCSDQPKAGYASASKRYGQVGQTAFVPMNITLPGMMASLQMRSDVRPGAGGEREGTATSAPGASN